MNKEFAKKLILAIIYYINVAAIVFFGFLALSLEEVILPIHLSNKIPATLMLRAASGNWEVSQSQIENKSFWFSYVHYSADLLGVPLGDVAEIAIEQTNVFSLMVPESRTTSILWATTTNDDELRCKIQKDLNGPVLKIIVCEKKPLRGWRWEKVDYHNYAVKKVDFSFMKPTTLVEKFFLIRYFRP